MFDKYNRKVGPKDFVYYVIDNIPVLALLHYSSSLNPVGWVAGEIYYTDKNDDRSMHYISPSQCFVLDKSVSDGMRVNVGDSFKCLSDLRIPVPNSKKFFIEILKDSTVKINLIKAMTLINSNVLLFDLEYNNKIVPFYLSQALNHVFNNIVPLTVQPQVIPQNNDGLSNCFWCGGKTKKIPSITSFYDYCKKCGK